MIFLEINDHTCKSVGLEIATSPGIISGTQRISLSLYPRKINHRTKQGGGPVLSLLSPETSKYSARLCITFMTKFGGLSIYYSWASGGALARRLGDPLVFFFF